MFGFMFRLFQIPGFVISVQKIKISNRLGVQKIKPLYLQITKYNYPYFALKSSGQSICTSGRARLNASISSQVFAMAEMSGKADMSTPNRFAL